LENVIQAVRECLGQPTVSVPIHSTLFEIGFKKSIDLFRLQSALGKIVGRQCPPITTNINIQDLCTLMGIEKGSTFENQTPTQAPLAKPSTIKHHVNQGIIGMGIDIEEMEKLPDTNRFRDHTFYTDNFNESELAYALLHADPKRHLCGIFSAKEAVRKSLSSLSSLKMSHVVIGHGPHREPIATFMDPDLARSCEVKISISYSDHYAVANAIALGNIT
jgi:holo-[acyl-carrier protein] synthase